MLWLVIREERRGSILIGGGTDDAVYVSNKSVSLMLLVCLAFQISQRPSPPIFESEIFLKNQCIPRFGRNLRWYGILFLGKQGLVFHSLRPWRVEPP